MTEEHEAEELTIEESEPVASDEAVVVTSEDADAAAVTMADLEAEIADLTAQLAELEQTASANLEGWQRSQAALENFRKRAAVERQALIESANIRLIAALLPVLDDFERAFANLPEELRGHSWLSGIELVEHKLRWVLENEGLTPLMSAPGTPFDPFLHQAVMCQESAEVEDGQIVAEVQRGYLLGEQVVRPAQVVVAKAPATPPAESEETDDENADAAETDEA